MQVLVAGSNGRVGRQVTRRLAKTDHDVRGMVREETQVTDVEALGAEAVVADLTEDVDHAVRGCDAIVFAAGSGGEDVWGVDRDGAIGLMESAESHGVDRFVMLSAINADQPERSPEALREYLRAKAEADERLRESGLNHTVVRPGSLTEEPGTGRVETGADLERGEIPIEDVARALVIALDEEGTYRCTFDLVSGEEPIEEALADPFDGA